MKLVDKNKIPFRIPLSYLGVIDKLIEQGKVNSRMEFIRESIKDKIENTHFFLEHFTNCGFKMCGVALDLDQVLELEKLCNQDNGGIHINKSEFIRSAIWEKFIELGIVEDLEKITKLKKQDPVVMEIQGNLYVILKDKKKHKPITYPEELRFPNDEVIAKWDEKNEIMEEDYRDYEEFVNTIEWEAKCEEKEKGNEKT